MILLDELSALVHTVLIGEIVEQIGSLRARGLGFLTIETIEHDLGSLARQVPRMLVMDRGCVIAESERRAMLNEAAVRTAEFRHGDGMGLHEIASLARGYPSAASSSYWKRARSSSLLEQTARARRPSPGP